jgi:cell division ATPase FtsA
VVLTGGTSKLPGIVDVAKDTLELPARVGSWKHIKRVVDSVDEQRFAPAVGLMLLDLYLGPAQADGYSEEAPGFLQNFGGNFNGLLKRFKK